MAAGKLFRQIRARTWACLLFLQDYPAWFFADPKLLYSRQALKKYILANNKTSAATPAVFDNQFNKALRTGVEKGDFQQPKGWSILSLSGHR